MAVRSSLFGALRFISRDNPRKHFVACVERGGSRIITDYFYSSRHKWCSCPTTGLWLQYQRAIPLLTLSLPRVINFKISLQPRQKFKLCMKGLSGFSYLTQMKDDYTTNSHYFTYTFLLKRFGEWTFWRHSARKTTALCRLNAGQATPCDLLTILQCVILCVKLFHIEYSADISEENRLSSAIRLYKLVTIHHRTPRLEW